MRHKYIKIDITTNINNLKNVQADLLHNSPSIYINFNIKLLMINKLGQNLLNRVPSRYSIKYITKNYVNFF